MSAEAEYVCVHTHNDIWRFPCAVFAGGICGQDKFNIWFTEKGSSIHNIITSFINRIWHEEKDIKYTLEKYETKLPSLAMIACSMDWKTSSSNGTPIL